MFKKPSVDPSKLDNLHLDFVPLHSGKHPLSASWVANC